MKNQINRRIARGSGAALLLLSLTALAQQTTLQEISGLLEDPSSQTVIYTAREFITMNPRQPRAEAIAVRGGKFTAVGSRDAVVAAAGGEAKLDDTFNDKVVMAGFIEQHVHPLLAALAMGMVVISIEDWETMDGFSPAVRNEESYWSRLRDAVQRHDPESGPFVTWGFHHYFHGKMSRKALNELAPDFPALVWHRSQHEFYLNDAALQQAGIDHSLIESFPEHIRSQIDFEKGHFYEQGAMAIFAKVRPLIATPEAFRGGLEYTEAYYHRNGITLACEPGGFLSKPLQDIVNSVYSDHETPFNHCFIGDGKSFYAIKPDDSEALIAETKKVEDWGAGRTWFLPNQVKLFTDGAIYSQLMQMKDGYTDGHHGAWIIDPEPFDFMFQTYWDAGYQLHVHNNGDAGMDVLLGSLEKAMERKPRRDHRTVLVHFGFATSQQVKRWVELGGIVSANPYYVTALAGRYAKIGVGPERSANMVPLGDVVKSGGSLSFHSDMPMAPAKPLQLAWAAVNRATAEGPVMGPQHQISVDRAMRAITIEAAYSIQVDDRVGSVEVGKDANLTILEDSPYSVAPEKLKDIVVWGTMLEGRVQPVGPEQRTKR